MWRRVVRDAPQGLPFSRFLVRIDDGELAAEAWGEPVGVARHRPAVEVKGAALTAPKVGREPDSGRLARCAVDV